MTNTNEISFDGEDAPTTTGNGDGRIDVDSVLFDLDGVLIDFCEDVEPDWVIDIIAEEIENHGGEPPVDPESVLALFAEPGEQYFRSVCREFGVSDPAAFWEAIQRRGSDRKIAALREGDIVQYPDTDLLVELGSRYDLGVVSNQPERSVREVLDYIGLLDEFEVVIGFTGLESNDYRKPNPGHLNRAMERIGGSEGVFTGDNERDVVAARRAGLTPVYLDRGDSPLDDGSVRQITSLVELDELLQ